MTWETMEAVLEAIDKVGCRLVDLTGGAPEMNEHLPRFIQEARNRGCEVQVRTNLTILLEEEYAHMASFFHDHSVKLVASLPCYLAENVDQQRGNGVYDGSIKTLHMLNSLGYGIDPDLELSLVYNPIGPVLPPKQEPLESAYRRELQERFGIHFTRLYTIANMPIGRFQSKLRQEKKDRDYMKLLQDSFNPDTLPGLMCRNQINIDWNGTLYDCDFNLAMRIPVNHGAPNHIRSFDVDALINRRIETRDHCFGCTAGSGSSCGGALLS